MCASFLVAPAASRGAELKQETLKTWDAYIQTVNSQMDDRLQGSFLWVDEEPDRLRRVRAGEILVSPVGPKVPKPVPSGLIHDWMGVAFIPNTKLDDVLSAVRDYGDYKEFYKPMIVDSKSLGTDGACDKYSMRVVNKESVETVFDIEYESTYFQSDERRWYNNTRATRVQEVRHYGKSDEQVLPPGQGGGFIWRLYSLTRFEERDGGVYVELEAIALSRGIPGGLRWMVDPIVRRVSKNYMLTSLQQMEQAVRSAESPNQTVKPSAVGADGSKEKLQCCSEAPNRPVLRRNLRRLTQRPVPTNIRDVNRPGCPSL
jgi:hypothetical protein